MAEKQFDIKLKATDKVSGPLKTITKNAKGMTSEFQRMQAEIRKTSAGTIQFGKTLQKIGSQMQAVGRKMTMMFTLPVIAAVTASIKKFADFEDGLVSVSDTTGLTGDNLKNLGLQIRALSKATPTTTNDLLVLAEVAGKAGAKTSDEIMVIVDTMNRLTAISKLSGEETTLALTRILAVSKEPTENIKKMGAALANLGDIVGEQQIIDSADAIGRSLAGLYNIGSANILALGTTFAKMNVPIKQSGTAVKKTMDVISAAVEKGKGGSQMSDITGLKPKELKALFKKDQFAVFQKFVAGLAKMAKSGKDIKPTLDKLKLLDSGIAKIVDQYDLFNSNVEITAEQYKDQNALVDESNAKWATTSARLKRLQNQFTDIGLTIGELVAPYLQEKLIPALELAIKWMEQHPKITKFAASLVLIGAVLGPVLTVLGTFVKAIGFVFANWAVLKGAIIAAGSWIGGSIALIGAWAVAIAGVGALAYVLIKNWKKTKEFFTSLWNGPIGALVRWTNPLYLLYRLGKLIVDNWKPIKDFFMTIWDGPIGAIIKFTNPIYLLYRLAKLLPVPWGKVGTMFAGLWDKAKAKFGEFYDYIVEKLDALWEKFANWVLPGFFGDQGASFNKNLTDKGRKALEQMNQSTQGSQSKDTSKVVTPGSPATTTAFKWPTMPTLGPQASTTKLVKTETIKKEVNNARVTVDFKNVPTGTQVKAKKEWWLDLNLGNATA